MSLVQRRIAVTLVGLASIVAGAAVWQDAASKAASNVDCLPGRDLPLSEQVGDAKGPHVPRGFARWIASVAGSSSRPGTVYATTQAATLYTYDGAAWHRAPTVAPASLDFVVGRHRDALYGTDYGALFRSTNGGRSWRRLICDVGFGAGATADEGTPSSIYLAAGPGDDALDTYGGLYSSRDRGQTWTRLHRWRGADINAVAADPRDPNDVTVAPYFGNLYRTRTGTHWAFTRLPGPKYPWGGQEVFSLSFGGAHSPVLWAGTTGGVFRRAADGTWARAGLRHGGRVSVLADAKRRTVAFAILGACVRETTDRGRSWFRVAALPCAIRGMRIQPADDSFYAWTNHTVFRSTDHGATWTRLPALPTS
jgi:hypothetical protein